MPVRTSEQQWTQRAAGVERGSPVVRPRWWRAPRPVLVVALVAVGLLVVGLLVVVVRSVGDDTPPGGPTVVVEPYARVAEERRLPAGRAALWVKDEQVLVVVSASGWSSSCPPRASVDLDGGALAVGLDRDSTQEVCTADDVAVVATVSGLEDAPQEVVLREEGGDERAVAVEEVASTALPTYDVSVGVTSANASPDGNMYIHGFHAEISLVEVGTPEPVRTWTDAPPWSRDWAGIPPGSYVVRAGLLPCLENCGFLGAPIDGCRRRITVDRSVEVAVRLTPFQPCVITVGP